MGEAPVLWRRLDAPGHESARLTRRGRCWQLAGSAVFAHSGAACRLDYEVLCAEDWRTERVAVSGWIGALAIDLVVAVEGTGRWTLQGEHCPAVEGCLDVDLNFSPATNLLPIRRLALDVGAQAEVRAAWLRFPTFELEPLEQSYTRTAARTYRYESRGGAFTADISVDDRGLVERYPGLVELEASG